MNNDNKLFAIFKRTKKSEKEPDYDISFKAGDKYETIGGCWLKEGKKGKFFSCKLSNAYGDRKGYVITEETPEVFKSSLTEEEKANLAAARASEEARDNAVIDMDGIPF